MPKPLLLAPNDSHRPDHEDYSVVVTLKSGRRVSVGRIFDNWTTAGRAKPWMWTVEFHQRAGRPEPHQGYCATRDEAMAAFKACWESAEVALRLGHHHAN